MSRTTMLDWVRSLPETTRARQQQHTFTDPKITDRLSGQPVQLATSVPPRREGCVRMALWLYMPDATDVDAIVQALSSPGGSRQLFEQQGRNAGRFMQDLLQSTFDTENMPAYISFTVDMEAAHSSGLTKPVDEAHNKKSCAVLCLVDVPLELAFLEDEIQQPSSSTQCAAPRALGVYGVLRRPFSEGYYTVVDDVVMCNYEKPHQELRATYAGVRMRMHYKCVLSTQIFLSVELHTHVHPIRVYHFSRAEYMRA
jgi:hypothetical protein